VSGRATILLVDDEPLMRIPLEDRLRATGYEVVSVASGEEALEAVRGRSFDVAVVDLKLPGIDGLDVLRGMKQAGSDADAIVITAYGTIDAAVEAMKLGARDFLTKPFETGALLAAVERCVQVREANRGPVSLAEQPTQTYGMVGRSAPMQRVFRLIGAVAQTSATIIIQGETGTGKELVANAIHACSQRRDRPLIKVNCAAMPEALVESELFGAERGAFTGADRRRKGRFELAHGGTLFLDEVDEMPLLPQAKVLRAIQEGEFERLGGSETLHVDVRIIAATKVDLRKKVDAGTFREDLYYRLNVLPIAVPPLRERGDDVILLTEHFLSMLCEEYGRSPKVLAPSTAMWLRAHTFPGNVRELKNLVARAVTLCEGDVVCLEHLGAAEGGAGPAGDLAAARRDAEDRRIEQALEAAGGNKTLAAQMLGISRKTLWEKLTRRRR